MFVTISEPTIVAAKFFFKSTFVSASLVVPVPVVAFIDLAQAYDWYDICCTHTNNWVNSKINI